MNHFRILALTLILIAGTDLLAQTDYPEDKLTTEEVAAHMNFLASDELQGRRTGSAGIQIAGKYIASHFASHGLSYAPGMDSWYQEVPYEEVKPPSAGTLTYEDQTFVHGEDILFLSSPELDIDKVKFVFAGYGQKTDTTNDYEGLNAKGKIVVTYLGSPGEENPRAVFSSLKEKQAWAKEEGAIGLVELYRLRFPWTFINTYFGKARIGLADESTDDESSDFFYAWINDDEGQIAELIADKKKGNMSVSCSGSTNRSFSSPNVIGYLEGTDPSLKDQVIICSAHYDHVGVGAQGGGRYSDEDSIFNGARDNAFGTVAVLAAAKAFSQNRPKRSVLFIAYSGEEIGLLGSSFYADHPVYPLDKTVFNMNSDGAGYSDTEAVSILGYGRMSSDDELDAGASAYKLRIYGNPAPEQGLFDRSDNVSLAVKGVPALTFSPGFDSFNRDINRYYHQVSDNPETIDMDYLRVFCQSFTYTSRLIADKTEAPTWNQGDKYEEAGKALYGSETE